MSKASKAIKIIELNEYMPFDRYEFINVKKSFDEAASIINKEVKNILRRTKGDKQKIINYLNKTSTFCIWLIETIDKHKKDALKLSDELNDVEILLFSHEERQFKKDHIERLWGLIKGSENDLITYDNIYLSLLESIEQKPKRPTNN